ncbi:hypothetical protein LBYZC6_22320 [Lacrimispora brassicae]
MKVFVQSLKSFNEGMVVGVWIKLGDNHKNLTKVLKEKLNCQDGEYNIIISDYDLTDLLYEPSEYENIFRLNRLIRVFNKLNIHEQDVVNAIIDGEFFYDLEEALEHKDCFVLHTDIQSDADLGHHLIEKTESYEIPDFIKPYIKFEEFGRDEKINSGGSFTMFGYLEEL